MAAEIAGAQYPEVVELPYPHFVRDGFFPDQVRSDIHRHWPGLGNFYPEIPGNYVCNLSRFTDEGFWERFQEMVVPRVVFDALAVFAPYIRARYPQETNFNAYICGLMQSAGDYGGHDVHNHHYHDPTFVATVLIYLDTVVGWHQGTTMLRTKPGLDEATCATQTLRWHDLTEEHETVEYRPGRIFSFYDNPIAYHSVKPSLPGALFGRRILRLHVGAPTHHCERLYGVNYETYQKKRIFPTDDPQVLGWMRKDIEEMRASPKITQAERIEWLNTLAVGVGRMIDPTAAVRAA